MIDITKSIAYRHPSNVLNVDPQKIANVLLKKARDVAEETRKGSPFQEKAIRQGLDYRGGKMDDITICVGIVSLPEDSPDRR